MKLKELIKNLNVIKVIGNTDVEIDNVQINSNSVTKGSLYVCLEGEKNDGHTYVNKVCYYGAVAVICSKEVETPLTCVVVDDCRLALSLIANEYYGKVSENMKLIGVVGTNGKTTTAHLIGRILNDAGIKCGVIGTLGAYYGKTKIEPSLTTPDPLSLHKLFYDMYDAGYKTVVMEVSAHAIYYKKISGLNFSVGILTNFSRDHLDFFSDMESYRNVKKSFFKNAKCDYVVVNADDLLGVEILNENSHAISYGIDNPSDVFAIDIDSRLKGNRFVINLFDCVYSVKSKLCGAFNVYNALAAATATALLGVSTEDIISSLNKVSGVEGRMQCVYSKEYSVYIDYAHTPDGLKKVLTSLKQKCNGNLICVFGCGGNRDVGKRREMGEISAKYSDFTVITSDNPRFEEPMDIIYEIERGVLPISKKYVLIQERVEGIKYALDMANKDDVVVIAGKGSENYQEILGIKRPYNDKDTVEEILRSAKN